MELYSNEKQEVHKSQLLLRQLNRVTYWVSVSIAYRHIVA